MLWLPVGMNSTHLEPGALQLAPQGGGAAEVSAHQREPQSLRLPLVEQPSQGGAGVTVLQRRSHALACQRVSSGRSLCLRRPS